MSEPTNVDLNWCGFDWQCCMEGGRLIKVEKPWVWYDIDCVDIITKKQQPDILQLDLKPYEGEVTDYQGTFTPQYGGGLIRSVDTFSYGTFSAEIMLSKGKGLWPSFWLCGEGTWPDSGEIDVMEGYTDHCCFRLFTSYFPWINPSWTTTTNVHYKLFGEHKVIKPRSVSIFKQPHQPNSTWIKYEAKWTPDEIVFSVDGKVIRKDAEAVKQFSTPDRKMRVIFNCLCENPDEHKVSIDRPMYVRNFQYQPL